MSEYIVLSPEEVAEIRAAVKENYQRIPESGRADDGFGNLLESPGGGWIRQANWFWYWRYGAH